MTMCHFDAAAGGASLFFFFLKYATKVVSVEIGTHLQYYNEFCGVSNLETIIPYNSVLLHSLLTYFVSSTSMISLFLFSNMFLKGMLSNIRISEEENARALHLKE
jgi:hypothetical protein